MHILNFPLISAGFIACTLSSALHAETPQKNPSPLAPAQLIEFTYQIDLGKLSKQDLPLRMAVPLAPSNDQQLILSRELQASESEIFKNLKIEKEKIYGNEYALINIDKELADSTRITVKYRVLRKLQTVGDWKSASQQEYKSSETLEFANFLRADRRVPIEGELIQKVKKDIPNLGQHPIEKSKAIYDYVVNTMEYKKVGTGWGNGDTYWACSAKYGNCTDFHALLSSLTRSEGIPSKFSIGFPIPSDKLEGDIPGYHCWLELYLPQLAWTPVDASEAKKHLDQRELFFGTHPADRILFSTGRDLKLPGFPNREINFFIYPELELAGKPVKDFAKTKFSFKIVSEKTWATAI